MRKWFVPLTVLGIGSVGALLLSEKGWRIVERLRSSLDEAPERIAGWNEAAQTELEKIQSTLNDLADTLQTRPAH